MSEHAAQTGRQHRQDGAAMTASQTARRMWTLFESVHAVTYFAAEGRAAFEAAGIRGFWRGYFAGRSEPLGRVSAAPVAASFYTFAPAMVSRALPAVWDMVTPEWTSAAGRLAGRGLLGEDGKATADGVALRACIGRATDAAAARPWPDQEFAVDLAGVLRPIALACAAEFPAMNPVGVPGPDGGEG